MRINTCMSLLMLHFLIISFSSSSSLIHTIVCSKNAVFKLRCIQLTQLSSLTLTATINDGVSSCLRSSIILGSNFNIP